MATLLVLVVDDETETSDILQAWEQAHVPGVTMLDSIGSVHKHSGARDDLPLMVSLRTVLETRQDQTHTFFSVIEDDVVVAQAIAAVLQIIPDFAQGHHGIMFTIPIARVWGYVGALP